MTREEAITKLHWLKAELIKGTDLNEPIDMAIEALQREEAEAKGYCHRILPSNVEIVVRCKDCRWYKQKQKNLPYNVSKRYCNRSCVLATKENDFCSYGERREP